MAKVLVVEDEKALRSIIVKRLVQSGFEVKEAEDGTEGVKIAREWKPDLVTTDLVMPNDDGYQLVRELRDEFKIYVLTNLSTACEEPELRGIPCDVKSDVDLSVIISKVKDICGIS